MEGDFHPEKSRLKEFRARGGVRVEVEALIPNEHPTRITTSRDLRSSFASETQDVERIVQEGDFKYEEGDRFATADVATYEDEADSLKLRGKRPMVWDTHRPNSG